MTLKYTKKATSITQQLVAHKCFPAYCCSGDKTLLHGFFGCTELFVLLLYPDAQ
jgi:hypothetical protein